MAAHVGTTSLRDAGAPRHRKSSTVRFELDNLFDDLAESAAGAPEVDSARHSDVGEYLREMGVLDAEPQSETARALMAAVGAFADPSVDEAFFLREPSAEPEVLHLQFRHAQATQDAAFLLKILSFERLMLKQGEAPPQLEIAPSEKARALALAMLSGNKDIYKVLIQFTSVRDADAWFASAHPRTRCECTAHRGSLLIRLVRGGQVHMARAALKGGLDPNSEMCDGVSQRMLWREPEACEWTREPIKLVTRFERASPLMAAAAHADARLLEALLEAGADPARNHYAAFGAAARYGNVPCLERLLGEISASMAAPDDAHAVKLQQACIVALKEASATGQEAVIDWVLVRLQQAHAWEEAEEDAAALARKTRQGRRRATFTGVGSSLQAAGASVRRKGSLLLQRRGPVAKKGEAGPDDDEQASAPSARSSKSRQSAPAGTAARPHSRKSKKAHKLRFSTQQEQHESTATTTASTTAADGELSPAARRAVSKALSGALDELVRDAGEPGSSLRDAYAVAIATITGLQKSLLAEFAPQQLLRFYMQAAGDEDMQPTQDAIAALLDCGLGDYLAGADGSLAVDGKESGSTGPLARLWGLKGRSGKSLYPGKLASYLSSSSASSSASGEVMTSAPASHEEATATPRVPRTRPPSASSIHSVLGVGSTSGTPSRPASQDLGQSLQEFGQQALQRVRLASLAAVRAVAAFAASPPARAIENGSRDGDETAGGPAQTSGVASAPTARARRPTALSIGVRASDKERHSALFSAVQRGHKAMVQLLLGVCNDVLVERLLMEAARFRQPEVVVLLLDELRRRAALGPKKETKKKTVTKRRSSAAAAAADDDEDDEPVTEREVALSNLVLCDAFVVALGVGDLDMAELLLDEGARPSPADLARALGLVLENRDRAAHGAVQFIFDFAAVDVRLSPDQVCALVARGFEQEAPNFPALRLIILHGPPRFVSTKLMRTLLQRSRGKSSVDAWRVLADLCVRNMERLSDDVERALAASSALSQEELAAAAAAGEPTHQERVVAAHAEASGQAAAVLRALLMEAESMADVHVGVLTLLMHACDIDPEHDEDEDDDAPSRWL